jgi:hypothetical protein
MQNHYNRCKFFEIYEAYYCKILQLYVMYVHGEEKTGR